MRRAGDLRDSLRHNINDDELLVIPGCFDALTARIIEDLGFKAANLGGFATGVTLGYAEHLLTLTEMVYVAGNIANNTNIPIIVDANGGFGSALHVQRTVKEFERVGVAGIYIEDQVYPKRAHYFKGVKHIIDEKEMVGKIKAALDARTDPNFVIIARTDAYQASVGGIEETISRANLYLEAGADVVLPIPGGAKNLEDAEVLAKNINGPAIFSNSDWKLWSSDEYLNVKADEVQKMGYKIFSYPLTATLVTAGAVHDVYQCLKDKGTTGLDRKKAKELRQYVEHLKKVEEHCGIEKKFDVEK